MGFIGLNLTVPHKLLAVSLVDHLDESARKWGAVNTVLFEGRDSQGVWKPLRDFHETAVETRAHGFNTDADAIVRSLREDLRCEPNGASILVLGAGGAGRTAALRLADEGARRLWLVNRTRSKAEEVASEIGRRSPGVEVHVGYPTDRVDLVLNATSLGLGTADPLPFEADQFDLRNTSAVYDMIYRPAETPLLALARTRGCRTANGLGMLLYQGARALEIWTGQTAPIAEMRRALEANVYG